MLQAITLCGRNIEYELVRARVKNINLRVRPDCSVRVSASPRVKLRDIEAFLTLHADFVIAALEKYEKIAKCALPPHEYVTGEGFRYLGKELLLKVAAGKKSVISDGNYLYLTLPSVDDKEAKARLIKKWFDCECARLFNEFMENTYNMFQKHGVRKPKLILRTMSTRWGSCNTRRGIITLNKRLIEAPTECIEYVVIHEFAHLVHPNHSKKFYNLVAEYVPDYKARKLTLEKYIAVGR